MIQRLFVERKPGFRFEAEAALADLRESLSLPGLTGLRFLNRYDIEGLSADDLARATPIVFSEPPVDDVHPGDFPRSASDRVLAVEFLPGQFDQRADSAAQCVQILTHNERPTVATARVYVLEGQISDAEFAKIRSFLINPVDSREASLKLPETLRNPAPEPKPVASLTGFQSLDAEKLAKLRRDLGLAMSDADLAFCQNYFRDEERRDPTLTEIRVLDTYWSDHCRHTTFLSELTSVTFDDSPATAPMRAAWDLYQKARAEVYAGRESKAQSLMDLATVGMKLLRKRGQLKDLEESEEINAASLVVPVEIDGKTEEWLVMFKNETHNHPTEIEPFGGAATCLGGAIRDPLSGRSYVYQAMRLTGSADPRTPFSETLPGKLPQRVITRGAARGYSSYGNQIGLATGLVQECYHPGFVAKRMEIGAVVAAGPRSQVTRGTPAPGDIIVLAGGRTGRDGIGGATGSSKEHTETALQNSAEVQKGDAPVERKLQRLFRDPVVSRSIKRCNDFGAGGVCVAIGELAPSLEVDLDKVPLKYAGLDGTEIATSESQERMAVVLAPADVPAFIAAATRENLEAVPVAQVTDSGRLRMVWRGQTVVNLSRIFLDTNGVAQTSKAHVTSPTGESPLSASTRLPSSESGLASTWLATLGDLNVCGQRGLGERFDASIGAGTVLHPFGGKTQTTPAEAMVALIPMLEGSTQNCTFMAPGYHPDIAQWSPYHGAVYAVTEAVCRTVAAGADPARIRLSLQEYFPKLGAKPERWGHPAAALLGALHAQIALGAAAIGGKDSMSGSFKDLDVPPTLAAFALAPGLASHAVSPEFKQPGSRVVLVEPKRDSDGLPDLSDLRSQLAEIHKLAASGKLLAASTVRAGGLGATLARMTFGNRLGLALISHPSSLISFFAPAIGSFVLELAPGTDTASLRVNNLGTTTATAEVTWAGGSVSVEKLFAAWDAPLTSTFPTQESSSSFVIRHSSLPPAEALSFSNYPAQKRSRFPVSLQAKPRVFIPVFPGSNCEYDTARAFRQAGADPRVLVFRNQTSADVDASLAEMARLLNDSQILMIPGGFSAGDEPDGSGKFIAAAFFNPAVRDATLRLLKERDGLILGICNGFQALIKLGLVPFGDIRPMDAQSPTLFHNRIARHVSRYVTTRVSSVASPWLSGVKVGDLHTIPVSHGEGRFTCDPVLAQQLAAAGQIAFQYCDDQGRPTFAPAHNPNESVLAAEAILSPCGRVLGKMAHSERRGPHVARNIPGNKHQPIFQSGVDWFRG